MYYEVYPDIIFIINFLFDLLLLFLLHIINRKEIKRGRMGCAATIGGIMATIVTIFPNINVVIRFMLIYIITSVLMIEIAFGRMKVRELLIQVVILFIITYFVGGLISSIYHNTNLRLYLHRIGNGIKISETPLKYIVVTIALIIPVILLLIWFLRGYHNRNPEIYKIELVLGDKSIQTSGMLDTGNCLYDPVLHKPVMIVENILMDQLISEELKKDLQQAKDYIYGGNVHNSQWDITSDNALQLRFIPYKSIGKTGMLPGILIDTVIVHKGSNIVKSEKVIAAIFNDILSTKDDYHVILHKELL